MMIAEKKLLPVKPGGRTLFRTADIEAYVESISVSGKLV
jgi:hypothetical protein|tara:strand:- start:304 stop:420 length:117 start_codon:yes stop_codon:yes gene_type:complete